jgi:hypothetical protein
MVRSLLLMVVTLYASAALAQPMGEMSPTLPPDMQGKPGEKPATAKPTPGPAIEGALSQGAGKVALGYEGRGTYKVNLRDEYGTHKKAKKAAKAGDPELEGNIQQSIDSLPPEQRQAALDAINQVNQGVPIDQAVNNARASAGGESKRSDRKLSSDRDYFNRNKPKPEPQPAPQAAPQPVPAPPVAPAGGSAGGGGMVPTPPGYVPGN